VLDLLLEVFLGRAVDHVQELHVLLLDQGLDDLQGLLLDLEVLALQALVQYVVDAVLLLGFTLAVVVDHEFVQQFETLDGEVRGQFL